MVAPGGVFNIEGRIPGFSWNEAIYDEMAEFRRNKNTKRRIKYKSNKSSNLSVNPQLFFRVLRSEEHNGVVLACPVPFGVSKDRFLKDMEYSKPLFTCTLATPTPTVDRLFTSESMHSLKLRQDPLFFMPKRVHIQFNVPGSPDTLTQIASPDDVIVCIGKVASAATGKPGNSIITHFGKFELNNAVNNSKEDELDFDDIAGKNTVVSTQSDVRSEMSAGDRESKSRRTFKLALMLRALVAADCRKQAQKFHLNPNARMYDGRR